MIPVKALKLGNLKFTDEKVAASGHEVKKCRIVDESGTERLAFYKPLDPTYPPMLAKLCVAIGVIARLSLGEFAADTRLVYDESGTKVIGTASFALKDMVTMQTKGDPDELDPEKALLKNPNVAYLMEKNIAKILVALWRHKDDDSHSGNVSFQGIFDYDMMYYNLTHILKGLRIISGVLQKAPEKDTKISKEDIHTFPEIQGRTHYPTNAIPGNLNLYKIFKNREEFLKLKSNPKVLSGSDETISFHEQFYSSMLNELLSFQPEVLKARLKAYLGDEKVSFSDSVLNQEVEPIGTKKAALKAKFSFLFGGFEDGNHYKRAFPAIVAKLASKLPEQLAQKINTHIAGEAKNKEDFEATQRKRCKALPELFTSAKEDGDEPQIYKSMLKGILSCPPQNLKQLFINYLKENPKTDCASGEKTPEQIKIRIIEEMLPLFEYSYVDLCSSFFVNQYRELYNTIVHYQGHQHEEEVEEEVDGLVQIKSVSIENPSFCGFLSCKPSAFQKIKEEFEKRNEQIIQEKKQTLHNEIARIKKAENEKKRDLKAANQKSLQYALISVKDSINKQEITRQYSESLQLSLDKVTKEYAARRIEAEQCIDEIYSREQLYDIEQLIEKYHVLYRESYTHKLQHYFDKLEALEKKLEHQCKLDSELEPSHQQLKKLRENLRSVTNCYYYEQPNPTDETNVNFRKEILKLLKDTLLLKIQGSLKSESDKQEITEIFTCFKEIMSELNIIIHRSSKDKELGDKKSSFKNIQYKSQTDPSVINDFIKSLFLWVDEKYTDDKETFHSIIYTAVQLYQTGGGLTTLITNRTRGKPVLTYLKNSKLETPSQKLAHILSLGENTSTSLNPYIISKLASYMVGGDGFSRDITVNLRAINAVLNGKNPERFDACLYAQKTQEHIQENSEFNYIYADSTLNKVLELFYQWAEEGLQESVKLNKEIEELEKRKLTTEEEKVLQKKQLQFDSGFFKLMKDTIKTYEASSYYHSRVEEVRELFQKHKPSGRNFLLEVFSNGGTNKTSYNTIALEMLFKKMAEHKRSESEFAFLTRYLSNEVDWVTLTQKIQEDAKARILLDKGKIGTTDTAEQQDLKSENTNQSTSPPKRKAIIEELGEKQEIESFDEEKDIVKLQNLIYGWVDKNQTLFSKLFNESLTEYDANASLYTKYASFTSWYSGPSKPARYEDLELLLKTPSLIPSQKLVSVFQDRNGGINDNSFNTIIYKKLLKQVVDRYKTVPGYTKLNQFNEDNFPWNAHLNMLSTIANTQQKKSEPSYSYSREDVGSQSKIQYSL